MQKKHSTWDKNIDALLRDGGDDEKRTGEERKEEKEDVPFLPSFFPCLFNVAMTFALSGINLGRRVRVCSENNYKF